MAPVFAHGRLRLYLLKLLDESPRHGYEVIRLLEERFQGLYAPSAGTVYPRLAKLEQEGLVTHATEGGRKIYALTDAGRAELTARADEIAGLEAEIRASVSTLAAEIREDVRGAAGDLRQEMRAAARESVTRPSDGMDSYREATKEWKEQAKRAKEDSRRAKQEAKAARKQAKDAADAMDSARHEVQRIARQVQEQVQAYSRGGDWQTGLREGLAELTRELGRFNTGPGAGTGSATAPGTGTASGTAPGTGTGSGTAPGTGAGAASGPVKGAGPTDVPTAPRPAAPPAPEAAEDAEDAEDATPPSEDPLRDLERLLDRFRDDVRDTARDVGVTDRQLREVRRHLSTAAAHITAALRTGPRT